MTRVLYVHGGLLNTGGTESVMLNYFRNIDRKKVHIDFLVHGFGKGYYDDEILITGSKIFNVVPKGQNYFQNTSEIKRIIKNGNYDAVHSHINAGNAHILKIAKQCGVPIRVSHSHNSAVQSNNPLKVLFNTLDKHRIYKYATHLLACSEIAGKWLYGKHPFTVINNAIDSKKYVFNSDVREELRKELGVDENTVVVGSVARYAKQKNHKRIVSIFNDYLNQNKNSVLLLIGEGELKNETEELINNFDISKNVRLIPPNKIIYKYLQAMDCFLIPSLYEGLPVVMVEAQAAGLSIVASNNVSKESRLTDLVSFVSLECDNSKWCKAIEDAVKIKRTDRSEEIRKCGFDISDISENMMHLYTTGELLI